MRFEDLLAELGINDTHMFLNNPSRIKRERICEMRTLDWSPFSQHWCLRMDLSLLLALSSPESRCALRSLLTWQAFYNLLQFLVFISVGSKLTPSPQPMLSTKNFPILSSVL